MSEEHQSGRNIKERRDPDDLCCILPIGPLPGTVTDFWRMVWQDNVEVIVMLINLMEGDTIRCQQYWPDCGYENYGPFQVTITHCKQYSHYCVRQLHLKVFILQLTHSNIDPGPTTVYIFELLQFLDDVAETERQSITHVQFMSWPEIGVPNTVSQFLTLYHEVDSILPNLQKPMVVHCRYAFIN